jgi:hypothetical protein
MIIFVKIKANSIFILVIEQIFNHQIISKILCKNGNFSLIFQRNTEFSCLINNITISFIISFIYSLNNFFFTKESKFTNIQM